MFDGFVEVPFSSLFVEIVEELFDPNSCNKCDFKLNPSYFEYIIGSMFLGKESMEFRGFSVEKQRRKFGIF